MKKTEKDVGVLALQGDFREHFDVLAKLGVAAKAIRTPQDLENVGWLIIPGGESTVIGKLLSSSKLLVPIRKRIKDGMPVWGTCAGAIVLSKKITGAKKGQAHLNAITITAVRNAFGRQIDSFEAAIKMPKVTKGLMRAFFIRAPIFESPGKGVEILARMADKRIIAAREENILITAFHPELAGEVALHEYFLSL